jgi:hypothetical protein
VSVSEEGIDVEGLSVEYLELHQVHVLGVPVAGSVDQAPDLDGTGARSLGGRVVPVKIVQQADDRVSGHGVVELGKRQVPRAY